MRGAAGGCSSPGPTAGGEWPNWLYVECGVLGLVSCELGFVAGPALVRLAWNIGVECTDGG